MLKFRLIISKDKFYIYRKKSDRIELEYIDGNAYIEYSMHQLTNDVLKMLDILRDNNNLETTDDIRFQVIGSADSIRNRMIQKLLQKNLVEYIDLESLLKNILTKLNENPSLMISKFGINYDGNSYYMEDGKISRQKFNLLSYTFSIDQIGEFLD